MANMHTEERIGEAWRLHRSGDNRGAMKIFDEILVKTPRDVDALYGLGLARRADGDNSGAQEVFQKALDIAENTLKAVDDTSSAEGHHGSNNLETNADDRYLMLTRMLKQRLAEVS